MRETTINSEILFTGKILKLRKETVLLPNGIQSTREIIDHAPAVVILPFQPPDTVYLVRQFRKAIDTVILEVPAGIIHNEEAPLDAAKRELQEETGFSASNWIELGGAYPSPGFCNEYMHFFLAKDLMFVKQSPDEDELIEVVEMSVGEFESLVKKKKINDGKTLISYYLTQDYFHSQ
ncbi:NUDIX hydrolase [Thermoproteota archaeon]